MKHEPSFALEIVDDGLGPNVLGKGNDGSNGVVWDEVVMGQNVEKVRALGANGVAKGSTLGVVWFEVGGGMVVEEALEQALCLFEFWGFSSFNGRKLVHVVNRIESVMRPFALGLEREDSFVGERDHDMVHKLKVIGQRASNQGGLREEEDRVGVRIQCIKRDENGHSEVYTNTFTRKFGAFKQAASFKKPLASEVPLTSHMLKVAKLSEEPEQSLLPPSGEVNAEESADKSQSGTNVQPLSQPKAPTAMKSKKQKIPSSTQPKVSKDSREMNPPTTTHLQATEELVVTVVPIQSLEASVTAEVQDNQPKAADTTEATI
ncbi:hypothetical protein Tco_0703854 [Tanacetum coccineum]|uniref:Uncharacterized protein n=1 Tax=Tanacetum coccineum TaxID=301880 RepID=A0ABQ4Y1Y9_9ASTR